MGKKSPIRRVQNIKMKLELYKTHPQQIGIIQREQIFHVQHKASIKICLKRMRGRNSIPEKQVDQKMTQEISSLASHSL